MIAFLCLFFPPVLLLSIRERVVEKEADNCDQSLLGFIIKYLLSVLFLNFLAIAITYLIFGHNGELYSAFDKYTDFTFHYLILTIFISIAEPYVENIFRSHFKFEIPINKLSTKCREFQIGEGYGLKNSLNIILCIYALVLVLLNFIRVFDNSFWGDEGYSIKLAQMSVEQMIRTTAADVHPPLYYLFLQALYHIFGNNGYTYHLSGFIPYLIIVATACFSVRKKFGIISAAIMVTMFSLLSNPLTYIVEVRMYSLGAMFVLLAYIQLYVILEDNKIKNWIAFCVWSLCAAYTHYYALITVAIFYVTLFILMFRKKEYIKKFFLISLVTIIAYLPWLNILLGAFERTSSGWWLETIPTVKETIYYVLERKWLVIAFAAALIINIIYKFTTWEVYVNDNRNINQKIDLSLRIKDETCITTDNIWVVAGISAAVGTVLVGLALSYLIRPFFVLRYCIPFTTVVYLVFGYLVSKLRFKNLWAILIIVGILVCNLPVFAGKIKSEKNLDMSTSSFLEKIHMEEDAEICSNNDHLIWSVIWYYYPENEKRVLTKEIPESFDSDIVYLMWTYELSEEEKESIDDAGYSYDEVFRGQFANAWYL